MDLIKISDLSVSYENNIAIKDIYLNIPKNTITAIVGPNGAGKSTLLNAILGLQNYDTGNVNFEGHDILKYRKNIAYVPQKSAVNWDFSITVFDIVLMGRYPKLRIFKRPSKKDREYAMNALKEMGIEELKDRQISMLSGGQKQRVFLARAICQDVDLFILDEPFTGVDVNTEKVIVDKFRKLQKEGKTVICVHHNVETLRKYFDYVVFLNKIIVNSGYISEISLDEDILKTYGG